MKNLFQFVLILMATSTLSAFAQSTSKPHNCGHMNVAYNDLVAAQKEIAQIKIFVSSKDSAKVQSAVDSIDSGLSNIQKGLQTEGCTLSRTFTDVIPDFSKQGCLLRRNALAYVQAAKSRLNSAAPIYDGYRQRALFDVKDAEWDLQTDLIYIGCK